MEDIKSYNILGNTKGSYNNTSIQSNNNVIPTVSDESVTINGAYTFKKEDFIKNFTTSKLLLSAKISKRVF